MTVRTQNQPSPVRYKNHLELFKRLHALSLSLSLSLPLCGFLLTFLMFQPCPVQNIRTGENVFFLLGKFLHLEQHSFAHWRGIT